MEVLSETNYSEWPEFILVTMFSILKCQGTEYEVIREIDPVEKKSFYGLTWDETSIYYMQDSGKDRVGDRGQLVTMDSTYLDVSRSTGEYGYPASHQIHYCANQVAITGPGALIFFDTNTESDTHFYSWGEEHVNAVSRDGNTWWVNSNNIPMRAKSEIKQLSAEYEVVKTPLQTISEGCQVHNVARVGDYLYICSSGEGKLLVYNLTNNTVEKEISGLNWIRGLTVTPEMIIVGSSVTEADRGKRAEGGCKVHLLDRETLDILDTLTFTDIGPVHEIRGTSGDLAHNGIDFPGV